MKKLYAIALLALAGLNLNIAASQYADEDIETKLARHEARSAEELEANYAAKQNRFGEEFQEQSPEYRLVLKAIEYLQKHINGEISLHHFHKMMDQKLETFKRNLTKNGREYGQDEADFFHKCKHSSIEELEILFQEVA